MSNMPAHFSSSSSRRTAPAPPPAQQSTASRCRYARGSVNDPLRYDEQADDSQTAEVMWRRYRTENTQRARFCRAVKMRRTRREARFDLHGSMRLRRVPMSTPVAPSTRKFVTPAAHDAAREEPPSLFLPHTFRDAPDSPWFCRHLLLELLSRESATPSDTPFSDPATAHAARHQAKASCATSSCRRDDACPIMMRRY